MFQPDSADFHLMILEEFPHVRFLELDWIVANVDLMFSPGVKGVKVRAYDASSVYVRSLTE